MGTSKGQPVVSYCIILTHNRPEMLLRSVNAIAPQVDYVRVVDNASSPPVKIGPEEWPLNVVLFRDPTQPPNLSKLWNNQLNLIEKHARERTDQWEVALLCDDAIAPAGWFDAVRTGLRQYGATAASTGPLAPRDDYLLKREQDGDVHTRMCGWAFVLSGESGIRADETAHWWFADNMVDWTARGMTGTLICPGPSVPNELPGAWTNAKPELGTRAGLDREAFAARWGYSPW